MEQRGWALYGDAADPRDRSRERGRNDETLRIELQNAKSEVGNDDRSFVRGSAEDCIATATSSRYLSLKMQ